MRATTLNRRASLLPPYYAPQMVARTVLNCAEHRHRDVIAAGLGGVSLIWMGKLIPRTTDRLLGRFGLASNKRKACRGTRKAAFTIQQSQRAKPAVVTLGTSLPIPCSPTAYLHPVRPLLITAIACATTAALLASRKR